MSCLLLLGAGLISLLPNFAFGISVYRSGSGAFGLRPARSSHVSCLLCWRVLVYVGWIATHRTVSSTRGVQRGESFFMVVEVFLLLSRGSLRCYRLSCWPGGDRGVFSDQLYILDAVGFSNQYLLWSRLFYTLEAHNENGTLVCYVYFCERKS